LRTKIKRVIRKKTQKSQRKVKSQSKRKKVDLDIWI